MSLPVATDYPFVGFVEADAIRRSGPVLGSATSQDIYADDILPEMEGWLSIADAKRQGLVGFYC